MKVDRYRLTLGVCLTIAAALNGGWSAAQETPQGILAVQIRAQGFACDKPQSAVRDKKRLKPDHAVWVLKCENATYRISRVPDMAATVERLR